MADVDVVDSGMQATIPSFILPDFVILKIFSYLPLKDVVAAFCVCKRWGELARSEVIWKKFIPFAKYVRVPGESAYEKVSHMWKNSLEVGKERWYSNPLAELVEFDSKIREAEFQQLALDDNSRMTLMLRLNPCYPFTTKAKDQTDPEMHEICQTIWESFGYMDGNALQITSHEDVFEHLQYLSRQEAMRSVLTTLQPHWFVDNLKMESYELDEDGNIVGGGGERDQEDDDDDDEYDDNSYNTWRKTFNKPLPLETYKKLKAIFADKSENFVEYYLSDGCFNENDHWAYSLVISDTAAYHIRQLYEL